MSFLPLAARYQALGDHVPKPGTDGSVGACRGIRGYGEVQKRYWYEGAEQGCKGVRSIV